MCKCMRASINTHNTELKTVDLTEINNKHLLDNVMLNKKCFQKSYNCSSGNVAET